MEEGQYLATLKFRSWGKSMKLGCYFKTDNGQCFYLYAWRKQNDNLYCPRDNGPNFACVKDGTRWMIVTKKSKKGNVFWSTAEILEQEIMEE